MSLVLAVGGGLLDIRMPLKSELTNHSNSGPLALGFPSR